MLRPTMLVLNTLAPVFLLIAAGAAMQRTGFVSANFLKEANRVTYWLGLPALVFTQLTSSLHSAGGAHVMLGTMFAATLLAIAAGYAVAWLMGVPAAAVGTFVQGGFRGNLAFVGLAIVYALPDVPLAGGLSSRAAAIVVAAPMMVLYNVAAVVVLLLSQHRLGWRMIAPFLKQLLTTPPLIATLAGITFAVMDWKMPGAIDQSFRMLGEMALPVGLLSVGGSLVTARLGAAWARPLGAALVKTAAYPLLAWLVARWAGLGADETRVVLILAACPTGIVSYTVAVELKGDEAIASGVIALSVLTSIPALALIVGAV